MRKNIPRLFATIAAVLILSPAMAQVPEKPVGDTSVLEVKEDQLDNLPVVSLDENDNQDGSAQNISGQANTGRNPFANAAAFNFSAVRFRIRGYDADLFDTYINGMPMENLDNGFTPYGLWGGLNDVLRNRVSTYGMQTSKLGFGSIGGASFIDARASKQRKQTSISYSYSNRNYSHRFMYTHSTGFNKKNWAFSYSGSRRWADEGFSDGTYYDGWSFYVGVDKKINNNHMLSFVAFGTPTENGRQGASVQEMLDIAGTNFYNPYWGYQDGKKRNASVAKSFQPIGIITHDWKINAKTNLVSAASYSRGDRSVSGLDWYNAPDPRPDYYRYLPSYQTDPTKAAATLDALKNDVNKRQINWDALYNANYANFVTVNNVNGIPGNSVTGRRSVYILENRIVRTSRMSFNTLLNTTINSHMDLTAGVTYQGQKNNYFKKVEDLLGGDFYRDLNQFAERDFGNNSNATQNDLNNPNRIVKEGDKLGYNYDINIHKVSAFVQTQVRFRKLDFFVGAEHSYTRFWREGNVKTGLFPTNSYGRGADHDFYNYTLKGGLTYKIYGGHYIFANASYLTKAPFFENAYLSARTRDFVHDNLRSEQVASVEAGYILVAPTVKLRATGYYTKFSHGIDVLSFYDDLNRTFGNYALSNIGRVHFGGEVGAEVIVARGLTATGAAAFGRYYYSTRQDIVETLDNTSAIIANELVYTKNFRVATPQECYTVGLNYRSPKFWFINVNFNYYDQMWLGIDPLRRTARAVDGVVEESEQWHKILDQTQLKGQYTVDIFAGYSWLMNKRFRTLGKRTFLVFNVGVNNILNNENIVTGGFEQLRYDYQFKNVDKFPSKKFYAYGLNFSANVALRF